MKVLFEDYYLLAIEKPFGLTSENGRSRHPSAERDALFYVTEQLNKNSTSKRLKVTPFLRVAHRLDRPAGGVLLLAKTKAALTDLMGQFERGAIQKVYIAQTHKAPPAQEGTLAHFIKKDETGRHALVFDRQERDTQACSLDYKVLGTHRGETLIEIHPKTGRFHQIRAQFAHIGCPIVGDVDYGGRAWREHAIKLFACSLSFTHPKSGEPMTLTLEVPEDFKNA